MAQVQAFVIAKVLLVNSTGQILAIRRSQTDTRRPGEWDFPGGFVDEAEDVLAAVRREATEEVGLAALQPQLVYAQSEMTPDHGSGTWLLYVAQVDDDLPVTLSYEHDDYKWVTPAELLGEITYHRQVAMLQYIVENKVLEHQA